MTTEAKEAVASSPNLRIRVVSYNILSSALCNTKTYPRNSPAALRNKPRLKLVMAKLIPEIKKQSLICLQEVSLKWFGKLFPLFNALGYCLMSCNYGTERTGFMGVAIGVPRNSFSVEECVMNRIGDAIRPMSRPSYNYATEEDWSKSGLGFPKETTDHIGWFLGTAADKEHPIWEATNDVIYAKKCRNHILFVHLKCKYTGREFVLASCHIPCVFTRAIIMQLHVVAAMRILNKFVADVSAKTSSSSASAPMPIVFAGDFNVTPLSNTYQLMSTGSLPCQIMGNFYGLTDLPVLIIDTPLQSAYAIAMLHEPPFTNYSFPEFLKKVFIGTIDYIWVSRNIIVESVDTLPKTIEDLGIDSPLLLPSCNEPSDHLMIGGWFLV